MGRHVIFVTVKAKACNLSSMALMSVCGKKHVRCTYEGGVYVRM